MKSKTCYWVLALFLLLVSACASGSPGANQPNTTRSPIPTVASNIHLRDLAQKRNLSIGAAVNVTALQNDPQYAEILGNEFNIVTPENVMKFDATEPLEGSYDFSKGDILVSFAQAHHMRVRGHNLVWHIALPPWLTNGTFTRDHLLRILKDHITTEVVHFNSSVATWDVVNEAIDENGELRHNLWLDTIGPDYIDLAFRWAHEANPQAHLFYNDYGGEGLSTKADAIYRLVKGMKERGVPIYGVGLQMHLSLDTGLRAKEVIANMKRLADLGLKVQITEMDVKLQDDDRPQQEKLDAEANLYQEMLEACLAVKECEAFIMWGFTDRYSWIPDFTHHPDQPLIFDEAYHRKPAYHALANTLSSARN